MAATDDNNEAMRRDRLDSELVTSAGAHEAEDHAEQLTMLGFVAQRRGDREATLTMLQRAVEQEPRNVQRHLNVALTALELGAYYEAIAHFEVVLASCGEVPIALMGLGHALMEAKQWQLAADRLERAVHAAPLHANAWSDLGKAYHELGRYEAALAALDAASKHAPQDLDIALRTARALIALGRADNAEPLIKAIVEQRPNHAESWLVLGNGQLSMGQAEAALESHERAVHLEPDIVSFQQTLANTELMAGHFDRAFDRLAQPWRQCHSELVVPPWNGEDLADFTLLLTEAPNDEETLLLSRYALAVRDHARHVVLQCKPQLTSLFSRSFPDVQVVSSPPDLEPSGARTCTLDGLPGLLGKSRGPQASVAYLQPDQARVDAIRARQEPNKPVVGFYWQGYDLPADKHHTMHLARLLPILSMNQIHCVSLQQGVAAEQVRALPEQFNLEGLESFCQTEQPDMDDVAAALCALDVVITADGALAHLSAALGRPTWLMMANPPRPFWGLTERAWYPRVRAFRQTRRGDYSGVVTKIRAALRHQLVEHSPEAEPSA